MRPTVTIKGIRLCVALAASRGVAPDDALRRLGVDAALLADPSARVPFELILRAWTELPELAGDPAFGLHAAELAVSAPFDVIDYATAQCATAREAFECVARYQRLLHDANEVGLSIVYGEARITQRLPAHPELPPHFVDFIVGQWALRPRLLTGAAFPLRRVELCRAPPADLAEHRRVFAAPLGFYAERNTVVFDAALLDLPLVRADAALAAVLRRHADDLLAALPDTSSATALLSRYVGETIASQTPEIARAAKALGMSARSLQRRLEEEGTSFKAVVDDARRALAITHLRDERKSITDVAFLVGFSETSAFSRAFRRWTGQSPIDWRRAQVA